MIGRYRECKHRTELITKQYSNCHSYSGKCAHSRQTPRSEMELDDLCVIHHRGNFILKSMYLLEDHFYCTSSYITAYM